MRILAGISIGDVRATAMANVTMVRIPDRCTRSASSQTAKVPTNWTMTEVETSLIRPVTKRTTRLSTRPSTMLPAVTMRSIGTTRTPATAPPIAAPTARR
jgi:hypothetical protein